MKINDTIMEIYRYKLFDIVFDFSFSCSALQKNELVTRAFDVKVYEGKCPKDIDDIIGYDAYYQSNKSKFLFNIDGVARYLVQNGNEIIVERHSNIKNNLVCLYLLGTCMSALLHQRNILPFHASGIRTEKGAILFAGNSGAGKSTTTGSFVQKGYELLGDDLIAIDFKNNSPAILPSFSQMKLWSDALDKLSFSAYGLKRIHSNKELEKFLLPIDKDFNTLTLPLQCIYVLNPSAVDYISIEVLDGHNKINALIEHTYQENLLTSMEIRKKHLQMIIRLSKFIIVKKINRPISHNRFDELIEMIENDIDNLKD